MAENDSAAGAHSGESRVLDAGALKALAHPLRVRIFDILSQYGPQTASSLAEQLGESSGATSYHLRALAGHQLIREVEGRGTARERWWERPRGTITISTPESVRTPSGLAASQIVVTETYRQRHEQLMRYLSQSWSSDDALEQPAELSTANTRLTREQFDHVKDRLAEIITEAVELYRDQEGDDVRPYLIRLDMFPIDSPRVKEGS